MNQPRRRWGARLAPTCVAALLAFLIYAPILSASERQLAGRDLYVLFYPLYQRVAQLQRAGELPERDPSRGAGAAILPDPLAQVCYPPSWIRAALPFDRGFKVWFLLHAVLAGAGAGLLARLLGASARGACLAAAAATLAGPLIGGVRHPNVLAATAWVGFAVAGFVGQELRGARGLRYLGLTAFALANMLLAGGIEVVLLLGLCAAAFVAARAWQAGNPRALARGLARIGGAALVGALLAAVHLWPCLLWLEETARSGALSASEASQWATHPVRLLELIVPGLSPDTSPWLRGLLSANRFGQPFHPSVHLGLPIVALAGWAALRGRTHARALGVAALLLLLIALGPGFWLTRALPLYDSWRYPAKALLPLAILAGALGGAGLRLIPARWQTAVFALTLLLGLLANRAAPSQHATLPLDAFRVPPPFAEAIRTVERSRPPHQASRFLRLRPAVREAPTDFATVRAIHLEELHSNLPGLFGIADLSVYEPLHHRRLLSYLRSVRVGATLDRRRLADDASVAYVLDGGRLSVESAPPRLRIVDGTGRLDVETYGSTRIVAKVALETAATIYISEAFDPAWRATLDGDPLPLREARVAFMSARVPAGNHRLVLRYQTRGLLLGGVLTCLGGLVLLLLLWGGGSKAELTPAGP